MENHSITLTPQLFYVDASDFSLQEDSSFYALTPKSATLVKYYGGSLICEQVILDPLNPQQVQKLICTFNDDSETRTKVKSYIIWAPMVTLLRNYFVGLNVIYKGKFATKSIKQE